MRHIVVEIKEIRHYHGMTRAEVIKRVWESLDENGGRIVITIADVLAEDDEPDRDE